MSLIFVRLSFTYLQFVGHDRTNSICPSCPFPTYSVHRGFDPLLFLIPPPFPTCLRHCLLWLIGGHFGILSKTTEKLQWWWMTVYPLENVPIFFKLLKIQLEIITIANRSLIGTWNIGKKACFLYVEYINMNMHWHIFFRK